MIKARGNILSIDIGSVAVSAVEVGPDGKVLGTSYKYHHGQAVKSGPMKSIREKRMHYWTME